MAGFNQKIWRPTILVVVGVLTLLSGLLAPLAALAHADRLVAGKYGFRVGLLDEPAYQNLPNGVDLTICQGECHVLTDGSGNYANPISDTSVYETLQVEVLYGSSKLPLQLTPVFRRPGKFSAIFVPTAAGDYSLRFFGNIGSDKVDETFNPAKDGFDAVQDIKVIQFPDKIGVGAASNPVAIAPAITTAAAATTTTTSNNANTATTAAITTIAAQTTVEVPATAEVNSDVQNQLATTNQQLQTARQEMAEAKNSAAAATTFAIIGIIVGLVGVLAAVTAILRTGRGSNIEAG